MKGKEKNMSKKLILITDLAGYGKVSMSAQMPILSKMGFDLYNLPTALVSNTLDYGKFEILTTTDYMEKAFEVWRELDFRFDAAAIGFLGDTKQIPIIGEFLSHNREKNPNFIASLDPIMADNGNLYNGISESTIEGMRELCKLSDYITPNWTEACLIAGEKYSERTSKEKASEVASKLKDRFGTDVIITGVPLDENNTIAVLSKSGIEWVDYSEVGGFMTGTGDIFSAIAMGNVLLGNSLKASAKKAAEIIRMLLELSIGHRDKFLGIQIEQYIHKIDFSAN